MSNKFVTYCKFFMIFIKFQKIIHEVKKMPFVSAKITLSLDNDKKNLIQSILRILLQFL